MLPESVSPLSRKADLAFAFNPYHANINEQWHKVRRCQPALSLSQMSDAYTGTLVLACGIEIKESGGDYNEALLQLGVWSAAGLEKLYSLLDEESHPSALPLLGITVIGHEWKIHISWKVHDTGEIVSLRGVRHESKADSSSGLSAHIHYCLPVRAATWAFSPSGSFYRGLTCICAPNTGRGSIRWSCNLFATLTDSVCAHQRRGLTCCFCGCQNDDESWVTTPAKALVALHASIRSLTPEDPRSSMLSACIQAGDVGTWTTIRSCMGSSRVYSFAPAAELRKAGSALDLSDVAESSNFP